MVFRISNPYESERKLSQSVLQVTALLSMYHAELARILGKQCGDIGDLSSGKYCIAEDSEAWDRASLFIEMYHQLFDYFDGDGIAMYHWMRAHNKQLDGTPHLLIVDDERLQFVHDYLQQANTNKNNNQSKT